MEIEKGRTARIRYFCRLQDGTPYLAGDKDTVQFKVGAGMLPPSLEMGIMGMSPGEHRVIRVPALEVGLFPFPKTARFNGPTPPGVAYDFGPGESGDVAELIPPGSRRGRDVRPRDVNFEVEILAVE